MAIVVPEKKVKNLSKQMPCIKKCLFLLFATTVIIGLAFLIIYCTRNSDYDSDTHNSDNIPETHVDELLWNTTRIVSRAGWNGSTPQYYAPMKSPISVVIIKHTGGAVCKGYIKCAYKVKSMQDLAFYNNEGDIHYSFLIGGDGNIYVGRGWNMQPKQRNNTIDIAFMGNYNIDKPTPAMIFATWLLLIDGVKENKLTKDYILVAHNQTELTQSPGKNLFEIIRTFPPYDGGLYFDDTSPNRTATSSLTEW